MSNSNETPEDRTSAKQPRTCAQLQAEMARLNAEQESALQAHDVAALRRILTAKQDLLRERMALNSWDAFIRESQRHSADTN